ncbi:MAG: hypothetical protein LBJ89_02690 [Holosporales bacterium]|jgi:hypothetical protein|nr:hypothetical protein [Holosporales bacterium]
MANSKPKPKRVRINLNPLFLRGLILQAWIVLSAKMFSMYYYPQYQQYPAQQYPMQQYPRVAPYPPLSYQGAPQPVVYPPGYPGGPLPPAVQENVPQVPAQEIAQDNPEQQGSSSNVLGNIGNMASNLLGKAFGQGEAPQEQTAEGLPQMPQEGNGQQYFAPGYQVPQAGTPQGQIAGGYPPAYPQQDVNYPQYQQAGYPIQANQGAYPPQQGAYLPQQGAYYPQAGAQIQQAGPNHVQQRLSGNPCFDVPAVDVNDLTGANTGASMPSSKSSLAKNLEKMTNSSVESKPGAIPGANPEFETKPGSNSENQFNPQQTANGNPQEAVTMPIVSSQQCVTYLPGGVPFVITSTNPNFQPISLNPAGGYIIVPVPGGMPALPWSNTNQYVPPQSGYVNLPYPMSQ